MGLDRETQHRRQKEILNVLNGKDRIETQIQLMEMLRKRGFEVTQSSISRDIKQSGVARSNGRYVIPSWDRGPNPLKKVDDFIRKGVASGPYLTILHCYPGAGRAVAAALKTADWPEIQGIVADDDTVFIATAHNFDQKLVLSKLKWNLDGSELAGGRRPPE
jgi:transcriptional regulator of arginine metabolism